MLERQVFVCEYCDIHKRNPPIFSSKEEAEYHESKCFYNPQNWYWKKHKDEIIKEWEEAQPWGFGEINIDKMNKIVDKVSKILKCDICGITADKMGYDTGITWDTKKNTAICSKCDKEAQNERRKRNTDR